MVWAVVRLRQHIFGCGWGGMGLDRDGVFGIGKVERSGMVDR